MIVIQSQQGFDRAHVTPQNCLPHKMENSNKVECTNYLSLDYVSTSFKLQRVRHGNLKKIHIILYMYICVRSSMIGTKNWMKCCFVQKHVSSVYFEFPNAIICFKSLKIRGWVHNLISFIFKIGIGQKVHLDTWTVCNVQTAASALISATIASHHFGVVRAWVERGKHNISSIYILSIQSMS